MNTRERLAIPPQRMPEQKASDRIYNQQEVPFGFTAEQAMLEAERCLQCKKADCMQGCPVGVDIPQFIKKVAEGDFHQALQIVKMKNVLPAVCGRVCPQEEQCQLFCMVAKALKNKEAAVGIGKLERFVADWGRTTQEMTVPESVAKTGKKAAIIGSGPAGLTVAGDLINLGHDVTVFEALHKPGGVLSYGIPEFRLPKEIVEYEVRYLEKLGVVFKYDYVIGKIKSIDEMVAEFDAVFIGTGAGLPSFLKIPGENALGVYSANEFLTRANLMKAYDFPAMDTPLFNGQVVATVGGGNVAMDSARSALRLGAKKSIIVYRRSEAEMPARHEEIEHAREEGVEFHMLVNPVKIHHNEKGWVEAIELIRMTLGEPDASGRRRPVVQPGSEFTLRVDAVVIAIGNSPNPLIPRETVDLKTEKWGGIIIDPQTGKTSKQGVWAGGDIVLGAATVILAMGHGRVAAKSMHEYMMTKNW
jgi:glutamate synthase (NADPH/NADH) small chain